MIVWLDREAHLTVATFRSKPDITGNFLQQILIVYFNVSKALEMVWKSKETNFLKMDVNVRNNFKFKSNICYYNTYDTNLIKRSNQNCSFGFALSVKNLL